MFISLDLLYMTSIIIFVVPWCMILKLILMSCDHVKYYDLVLLCCIHVPHTYMSCEHVCMGHLYYVVILAVKRVNVTLNVYLVYVPHTHMSCEHVCMSLYHAVCFKRDRLGGPAFV